MCRTKIQLEQVVQEYRGMKSLLEEITAEVKFLEHEIINYMDTNQKLIETGSNFTIKLSTCERRTLDAQALESAFGSLAEYQRLSQYRRLYIK